MPVPSRGHPVLKSTETTRTGTTMPLGSQRNELGLEHWTSVSSDPHLYPSVSQVLRISLSITILCLAPNTGIVNVQGVSVKVELIGVDGRVCCLPEFKWKMFYFLRS